MSLFQGLGTDIAEASLDPFELPDGVFRGAIIKAEAKSGNRTKDNAPYRAVVCTLSAEGDTRTHDVYLSLPMPADTPAATARKLSNIKKFLTGLEIPESRFDDIGPADLLHLEVVYKLQTNKNGFRDIEIQLAQGNPVTAPTGGAVVPSTSPAPAQIGFPAAQTQATNLQAQFGL